MTIERFMAWAIFAFVSLFIGLIFQPFAYPSGFAYVMNALGTIGFLSLFWAIVQRYRTLGYPGWMGLISPILALTMIIGQLAVSWLGLWEVILALDEPSVLKKRDANETYMTYIVVAAFLVSVLFSLFGKPRPE